MAANTAPVSVASKNLYELLGNDPDQDPDLRVEPTPVNPVDKTQARTGKRNGPSEAPVTDAAINGDRGGRGRGRGRGARGRGRGGNEQAFLDNDAGHARNRDRPTPEGRGDRAPRGSGEGRGEGRGERRGGRGRGRGQGVRDDRHSRTVHSGPNDQAKQAAHGWGGETGIAELQDEQAGEAIAFEENKGADNWNQDEPVNADGEKLDGAVADDAEPEPEDKTKSYADYIAEQAQKKLQLGGSLTARKANEGTSVNHPEGKTVEREETDYFAGAGAKARRERERKEKNVVVLDHDIGARDQPAPRGGRGGRGRGRGDGPFRGEGRGRGGFRGRGEGRGEGRPEGRGEFRGRGGRGGPAPNLSSAQDFPGLGK